MGYDVPMERRPVPDLPSPTIAKNVVTFRVNTDIAAGYDQPAQPLDDWEGAEVELPVSMLHGRSADDYFVIRICGDSMYPQYQNGDYVLVLRTNVLDYSGQVAVMLHGEEGTIKKWSTKRERIGISLFLLTLNTHLSLLRALRWILAGLLVSPS